MSSRFLGKVLNAFSFHLQLARMFNSKHVSNCSVPLSMTTANIFRFQVFVALTVLFIKAVFTFRFH